MEVTESTELFKTSHHFLTSPLNIQRNGQDDQSSAALPAFRRTESEDHCRGNETEDDCRRSESAVFPSSAVDEVSAAVLARQISISRSGRYKSKSKQRASLLYNSLDYTNTTVVFFADDTITSGDVAANPPTITSVHDRRQSVQSRESSSQPTDIETKKADASTVEEIVTTSVTSSAEERPKPVNDVCSPTPPDICLEQSIAEVDESTDL